jgi:arylsulfatase A-like enzyme
VETGYATSVNVNDAINWLDGLEEDQPWLLWMAFNAPHSPYHKPPNDLHDYDQLEAADDVAPARAGDYYLAMLQALDTEIGRLFAGIRANGDWDDTVVIFIGDNGSARGLIGDPFDVDHAKDTLTEGGTAVPFVVAGPGISGGRSVDAIVSVVDIFTTALEVAGVDVAAATSNDPVDSVSLWGHLTGETTTGARDYMLSELFGGRAVNAREGQAIRDQNSKLICYDDGGVDLFDLSVDRWEADDLYGTAPAAGFEGIYADLASTMETWIGDDVCP